MNSLMDEKKDFKNVKTWLVSRAMCSVVIFMLMNGVLSCSGTREMKSKSILDDKKEDRLALDKDALRITGMVTSKAKAIRDRYEYRFTVNEILVYGATFATVEPNKGEEVLLMSFSNDLKKGSIVTLDVFTPLSRGTDEVLLFNRVSQ